ncbi:hypothetical protein BWI93_02660 [Siphonobacter sp. BAB-5385]|uniref:hypothetical protein n=1 Tax=Siphonobacter sp. BAB-5385 TaxID=1864822 RepID=UPI000B9E9120|nr:hypothetical protein [Siphonobacter sp. BAB-5385]OZI09785.1 hypothetical protein BWI93_02660 [Siphonobacter sp. BAB-5385]
MKITIEVDPKTEVVPGSVTSDSTPSYAGGEPQGTDPASSNTGTTTTSGDQPAGEPPVWLLEAIENAPRPSTAEEPMGTSAGTVRLD